MRKILLLFVAIIVAANVRASVKVTENPSGTVTIAVDGAAGQIGTSGFQYTSAISSDNQKLIKTAQHVIITGNINGDDIKTLVERNKTGNNWTLNTLDMKGASIDKITVEGSEWYASSHTFMPNGTTRISCKKFVFPHTNDGIVPDYFSACFQRTNSQLETVIIPNGYKSIGKKAFNNTTIKHITLPNSLESIGEEAFVECHNLKTIAFPTGLKTIGDKAFNNTKLMDVYFLGKEAPIVGNDAFDAGTYKGNGGMIDTTYPVTSSSIGDTDKGYAERRNYINGANTFGLLHLRADLTNEQRAKYTDITRDYRVEKGSDSKYKAFNDLYYGTMKVWPGQYSYEKTFNDAVAGTLWDGTTTYDKDKYMGLHKFTITVSNVYNDDTEKWNFGKKGQQWWTICVPFNMTKAQVTAVFGANTEVCKMSSVVRNKEKRRITLKFKDDQYKNAASDDAIVIKAHEAYMIFPTASPTLDLTFEGYQLEEGSPIPTIISATEEGSVTENGGYTYRFIGNYLSTWNANENNGVGKPIYMPQYTYFLGAKGGKHVFFYQTGTTGKWNPFSATVQVFKGQTNFGIDDSFVTESGAKTASFFGTEDDSHTTGIEDVTIEAGNNPATSVVYTLDGRIAGRGQQALNGLKSGIYIVNGKKIVVR
ncbi:leucine-rich repeat domain-containing protein [Prevotella buccae]|uniref:leucine-rich repeat domain-containing protein n=1 Tax=Segatella buccae TaxID=28126 RepID=UPI001C603A51|nr:leucine-rich repeat domain-containing protein [Segatella buccae]MBW4870446.1 leucine-rich repeat domain-containing protein [Segatella buccae]